MDFILEHIKAAVTEFISEKMMPFCEFTIHPLAGDGSQRSFERVVIQDTGETFIVMVNFPLNETRKKENYAYLMIGRHLIKQGLPLPEIFKHDLEKGIFIMEDLGNISLQDEVLSSNDPIHVYRQILNLLLKMQLSGKRDFNTDYCCQTRSYDISVMREREAHYFRDSFLVGYLDYRDGISELESSFEHLFESVSVSEDFFFMHRDFQSRNIMKTKGGFAVIDWQGARLGPLGYDLASLLIDPYVNLSNDKKDELYDYYLVSLGRKNKGLAHNLEKSYPYIAVLRNLQILGAFSFLTLRQGKDKFKKYIPSAVESLYKMLNDLSDPALTPLCRIAENISRNGMANQD